MGAATGTSHTTSGCAVQWVGAGRPGKDEPPSLIGPRWAALADRSW